MHTGFVTLLLLTVTLRYLGRAAAMIVLSYLSLRESTPSQRPRILGALSPALRAVAGSRRGRKEDEGSP